MWWSHYKVKDIFEYFFYMSYEPSVVLGKEWVLSKRLYRNNDGWRNEWKGHSLNNSHCKIRDEL